MIKLRVVEDTACVASKTPYIDDTGIKRDKDGIYYIGRKPKEPKSWRDYKRNDNKKISGVVDE